MNATGVGSGNTHYRGGGGGMGAGGQGNSQAEPTFSCFHKMPLRCLLCGAQAAQHSTAQGYGGASVLNSARVGEDRGGSSLCAHTYILVRMCPSVIR